MNKNAIWTAALLAASMMTAAGTSGEGTPGIVGAARTTEDLTLDEAVRMAVRQNPDILKAEDEIRRTRGVVLQVQAQALPQVVVGTGFSQESKNLLLAGAPISPGGSPITSGSGTTDAASAASTSTAGAANPMTQSWDVTVTASQLIYSGGQVVAAIHIARDTMDATIYSLRDVVDTTIADVRAQFYAVLLDRAIINVQEENINLLQSQLTDQQNRFEAGTVPRFNVLQAEVALANARPQLIQARDDYNVAVLNLARTLGISSSELDAGMPQINPVGVLTTDEKPELLTEALQLALERRPYLKEQREQVLIQIENIKVALAGYQPRLSVDGGYEARNDEYTKSLRTYVTGWFFGITGNWDVWDSGATYGEVKQAKAQLEEAKDSFQEARARSRESVMLDVRRVETLKQGNEMVGNRVKVKVVKNKCAPPFRQAEFDIMFGKGISRPGSIVDIGVEMELITKSGSWFTYKDLRIGQGRENAKQYLEDHPELMQEIEDLIRNDKHAAEILTVGTAE